MDFKKVKRIVFFGENFNVGFNFEGQVATSRRSVEAAAIAATATDAAVTATIAIAATAVDE